MDPVLALKIKFYKKSTKKKRCAHDIRRPGKGLR